MKNLKFKWLLLSFILSIASINTAWAVTYNPSGVAQHTMQSPQVMQTGGAYNGTVYEPFSNTTPSEQSYSPAKAPGGPRREKIDNGDDGEGGEGGEGWIDKPDYGGTELSPIGEPWILALFALAFAGMIAIRQYKRKTVKSMNMKNSTNKFIATLALLCTMSVGQMWAYDLNARFYFYNEDNWENVCLLYGNDSQSFAKKMFRINNTKLWCEWPTWNDYKDMYFIDADWNDVSNYGQKPWSRIEGGKISNYVHPTNNKDYKDSKKFYFTKSSNQENLPKYTAKLRTKLSENGGDSYGSEIANGTAWKGVFNFTGTYMDNDWTSAQSTISNLNQNTWEDGETKDGYGNIPVTGEVRFALQSTDAAYEFVGWGTGSDATPTMDLLDEDVTYNVMANTTYIAFFKRKQFAVTFAPKGTYGTSTVTAAISTTPLTSGSSYNYGSAITFTATPATGYKLNPSQAWYSDASCETSLSNGTINTYNVASLTSATSVYVKFAPKQSAITFDYQTSAAGYNDGANGITNEDLKGTYDAEMTALTGTMPSAKNGYKFMGFYDATGGSGTKYYNADGTSAHEWDKDTESETTLYAYYQPAEMSLALAALTIGTGEGDSATVSITPAVGSPAFNQVGPIMFCYDVKIKNGASMDPQPVGRQFTEGGVLKYRFASPRYSGNYTLNIKLRAGSDCSGAQVDSKDIDFIVSGDHTVTIRHKCGDVEIHEPTTVTIHPGETGTAAGFEDADVFGYHFSTWTIGGASGVTKASGELTNRTITISAIYDGTITATYTKRNLIYFKNTLNWPDVWIHFLEAKKWDTTQGTGNRDQTNRNKHMTRIGETDVWYFDYTAADITPNGFEVFTDRSFPGDDSKGFGYFHGTSSSDPALVSFPVVYDYTDDDDTRYGFHAGTPMFVPITQEAVQKKVNNNDNQIALYYNRGYWREYEPVTGKTGYTVKVYDKCENSSRKLLQSKAMIDSSDGAIFEATVDLEAGKTYGIKFLRGDDWYYTNTDSWASSSTPTDIPLEGSTPVSCYQLAENHAALRVNTTVSGNYTFKIYCSASDGKLKMSVKYPATTSDYRIVYHDDATWTPENGAHAAGWIHPSHVITKRDGGEDIVSFFVKADKINKPTYRFQYLSNLSPITWTNMGVSATTIPDSILNKGTGVYNFHLKQEGGTISVVKIEPYTGNYYIRTDNAGSTKWADFRSSDHLMTYSEYADKKKDFTHYYMKFVTTDVDDATSYTDGDPNIKNVKFCIANDYSMCISDTLKQSSNDATHSHVDANGDLQADANIRFMWNIKTNALSRKYLSRGQSNGTYFLVMKGQSSSTLMAPNGDPLTSANNRGVEDNSIQFKDNQDWIYEAEVKAKPTGRIKLYARYHSEDQYFYGDNDGSFADPHGVELIGGSADGAAEVIRAIYDFKTDRLMAAWVPSGDIDADKTIEADIMLVREGQNGGGQINLAEDVTLTTSVDKRVYGVMRFNRWDLNNLSRESGHAALDPGDQKSAYERFNYFISFPFDVKVGEIFGFGRIGRHYRIYFYDGIGRAQEGFFAERKSNWKMIDDTDSILHAYQGYFLQLNSVRMATTQEDVWPQAEQSEVELYFPAMRAISSITIANETIPALALDGPYKCNKDLSSLHGGNQDANRTNKDSYWRCIGTPSFANYDANFVGWTGFDYEVDDKAMPYLYEWETTTNKLVPVASTNFRFLSMHAYLIQNPNQIIWANASKPTYSAIVARTRDAETEHEWKLTLTDNNEGLLDQTFVRMSDNEAVTANFDFGQDLVKEWNEDANIYTFIESEQVAANSMPFSDQTTIVPVGVKIASDGEYTFAMPEGTEGVGVVLIDNIAGTRTNLALMDYTVNLTAGTYDGRFSLEISPIIQSPTGIEQTSTDSKDGVRKVMVDGILYIVKDGRIYDATGNRVQ